MDAWLWLDVAVLAVLFGLSAFFSSSETSLFSLDRRQLDQLRRERHPRADLIERLLSQPRRLIVTILIGNELVNVSASAISATILINHFQSEREYLNLLIMVPLLLLFGEITPKTLAIKNNIAFAAAESRYVELFARLIAPLRNVVRQIADYFTTQVVGAERIPANIVTEDLVRSLAKEAVGTGALDNVEASYINHIFDFGEKTLGDVMSPRSQFCAFAVTHPLREIVAELQRTRYTKVPIYEGERDHIIGILYARDLLAADLSPGKPDDGGVQLRSLLRTPYVVPETKPVADLFHTFRRRKLSMALTVDEYGGITGLVTMEDLLECIFGDIPSASELVKRRQAAIEDLGGGKYRVEGSISIDRFSEATGIALPREPAETLGGLLLHEFGELPPEGSCVIIDDHMYTVLKMQKRRIGRVLVKPAGKVEQEGMAASGPMALPKIQIAGVDPEQKDQA
ncbi:MAG: HlyC/CorC family transporter [Candidatus Schekmanbacteria bacterium]|nr:HlyC/CorC family transporter [Candidatus Schekmanbacteria bacterium]